MSRRASRSNHKGKHDPKWVITVSHPPLGRRDEYIIGATSVPLSEGTPVVTSSQGGLALGRILRSPHRASKQGSGGKGKPSDKKLVRIATEHDLQLQQQAQQDKPQIMRQVLRHIREQELPLKLVELAIDGLAKKINLCVLVDQEQDSDKIAASLGRALNMKVQLHQLGDRDQAKVLGGVGRCGRPQCCSSHLDRYPKLSIKMAKTQGVSLSQEKTNGNCGRTLCCLNYENSFYEAYHQYLPRHSKRATTTDGLQGKVVGVDVLRQTFTLRDDSGKRQVLPASAWEQNRGKELPEPELGPGSPVQKPQSLVSIGQHSGGRSAPTSTEAAAEPRGDDSAPKRTRKRSSGSKRRRSQRRSRNRGANKE